MNQLPKTDMHTDTERLDAIGGLGLCVVTEMTLVVHGEWTSVWKCYMGQLVFINEDMRVAIDEAIDHHELMKTKAN